MRATIQTIATWMTAKYVLTLLLLAILAIANFLLLRAQIDSTRSVAAVVNLSGQQRALLQRSVLLTRELIAAEDKVAREERRTELTGVINQLEATHEALVRSETSAEALPAAVQQAFFSPPWSVDREIRDYVARALALVASPADALHPENPHFRYLIEKVTSARLAEGLHQVVRGYVEQGQAKADRLQMLSNWSLVSMLVILLGAGYSVFRPMVGLVRQHMSELQQLNETLDLRVHERTALANQRADELAISQGALRDSEALYRSLVDNLPMCVMRKDRQGKFLFVNERFCELQNASPDKLIGLSDEDLYPPALAEKYRRDDECVLQNGRVLHDVERFCPKDGAEKFVEVLKSPLVDASGATIGTQTVFWDVTDRTIAEQRAQQAERLAAIGQVVSGVAHESRNALQQIEACSQMLLWEVEENSEAQELLSDLRAAQRRLLRLFEDLRGYSAPIKLERQRVNLVEVIDAAWKETAPHRDGNSATLQKLGSEEATCQGDGYKLEQVFRNLFENSLAACGESPGIKVSLDTTTMEDRPAARVTVEDNGPGLNDEQRLRIFDAFYTTKSKGSGLGMAIVKRIVEAHDGTITIGGGDGGGAQFVITLPQDEP